MNNNDAAYVILVLVIVGFIGGIIVGATIGIDAGESNACEAMGYAEAVEQNDTLYCVNYEPEQVLVKLSTLGGYNE